MLKKIAILTYGVVCYVAFLGTFLYAIGFVGDLLVEKSIDSGPEGPLSQALLVNAGLLGVFALQHSIMARRWFKQAWTRVVPEPAERSTYVLFSSVALVLMFWFWQPMGGVIWRIESPGGRAVAYTLFAFGWLLVLVSTFMIDHFDLFGLRQVYLYFVGKEYTKPEFRTPGLYQYVRHPLYVGWFFTMWATPDMTAAHLVFAVLATGYILTAIQFEERDLVHMYGDLYRRYKEQVPMLLPFRKPRKERVTELREAA